MSRIRPVWSPSMQAWQLGLWSASTWARKAWLWPTDKRCDAAEWPRCRGNTCHNASGFGLLHDNAFDAHETAIAAVMVNPGMRVCQVMKRHNVPTLDLNAVVHSHCGPTYTECPLCDNETEYMGIQCGTHSVSRVGPVYCLRHSLLCRLPLQQRRDTDPRARCSGRVHQNFEIAVLT